MMNIKMNVGGLLLGLLLVTELYAVAPVVRKASFHKVFDNRDYYGTGYYDDMSLKLSAMSSDGKVVAFYGTDGRGENRKLFIHNFESTAEPVEVTLPSYVGNFNTNTGLVSNADGTRIFFHATDTVDTYHHLFGMVNGKTGDVTILFRTVETDTQTPQDMSTDAAGDYLYFNQRDDGYGKGNLLRLPAMSGAAPSVVIDAASIPHPSGGTVKFIDQFDLSNDGQTIVFFGMGWDKPDGTSDRYDKELFAKTSFGIENLTNNTENGKEDLVISGNGTTIVYTENDIWMVTAPSAAVGTQRQIETDYRSCGDRPGITKDGSMILGRSTYHGTSSCNAYLIQIDGHSRLMIEPHHISILSAGDGLNLSEDGKRIFFKNRWYVYPDEWYDMTVGVFGDNLWSTEVPSVTAVSYPGDLYAKLENNENPEARVIVNDPQNDIMQEKQLGVYNLLPSGYEFPNSSPESQDAPVSVGDWGYTDSTSNTFYRRIIKGPAWPARIPVMTARFSVLDDDFNVGYVDTLIQSPLPSDFTANGSNDLLWHKASTGAVKIMGMNSMLPEESISVATSSNTNLLPKGIGDFTGDGKPDILFHNQNSGNLRIWEMNGTTKVNNIQVLGSSNTNLQIAGVGDFDSDGDNDIATFNTNSGALRIWVMEGTKRVDNVLVLTGANTNLVPRGVGDMDSDGIPDIVLRNNHSGKVRIWTMNADMTRKSNVSITSSSNTNLELRGVMDINGDGNNDILNYNTNTGKLRAWLMDGNLHITENAEIVQEADLDWSVRN